MLRNLRKLAALDARSFADLLAAQAALLRARHQVNTQPIGSLTTRAAGGDGLPRGDALRARALALAITRAANHGIFRPFCPVRAMALRALLERAGITGSEIRVGVRRSNGVFAAHAWVRWGHEILGDDPRYVGTFTEVDDIRVLGGA